MLDHIGLVVRDYGKSRSFYDKALGPLGVRRIKELVPGEGGYAGTMRWVAFGREQPELWIGEGMPAFWTEGHTPGKTPMHLALRAADRSAVDAFHREAVKSGGRDLGAPGLRPHYHAHYYAAYISDPDGNNLEVVCHEH